ncbi:MAG: YibE/F family protein [Oscillospiraceae bacterium]|nr:YibE/F family protein [Oscillospiraceae bacterium]
MTKKQKLIWVFTVVLSAVYIIVGNRIADNGYVMRDELANGVAEKMKVVKILDTEYEQTLFGEYAEARGEDIILFEGEFLNGYKKGSVVRAVQREDKMYAVEMRPVQEGNTIIVYNNPDSEIDVKYMFAEFHRVTVIWVLIGLFCLLLLLFGRSKGVNTLISLVYTIGAIFLVFIPAVLANGNIYLWAIITCVYIILMTLLIVSGFTRKSLGAIIGCAGGVMVSGILVFFCDIFLHMSGLVSEDSMYLMLLNPDNPVDIKAIIFASIIIGAVGAIMDVSMSLSSALAELKEQAPDLGKAGLIRSGFVIGRDIMGTMSNTLILAYIGSSLSTTLLLVAYNSQTVLLFNTEMIVMELLNAVAGSFGILLTIPLTSVVCGVLYDKKQKSE